MSKNIISSIGELREYLSPYFNGTKTDKQAWEFFNSEQAQLRAALVGDPATLAFYLEDSPHYVAAALIGKVEIRGTAEARKLQVDFRKVTIEELRDSKSLAVDPEVRPLLDVAGPSGKLPRILAILAHASRSIKLPKNPDS